MFSLSSPLRSMVRPMRLSPVTMARKHPPLVLKPSNLHDLPVPYGEEQYGQDGMAVCK